MKEAPPPRTRRRRLRRLIRVVAAAIMTATVFSAVMTTIDTQVRTPIGAAGLGRGRFPVVEIAGLASDGRGFAALTAALVADGATVLDFDPSKAGIQPLAFAPESRAEHIPHVATRVVQPAIEGALSRAGFDPHVQVVDVVAHSLGGLLMRFLIEQPGAEVDRFSAGRGWYGDGAPAVEPTWAQRVDDLVMVAAPNHGSAVGRLEATLGPGHDPMDGVADDMRPGSPFLRRMGTAEPPGEVYTTIGGDPWMFRWLRHGHHGFDGAVPAESPFMTGAATDTFPQTHGRLLSSRGVISLIVDTLKR